MCRTYSETSGLVDMEFFQSLPKYRRRSFSKAIVLRKEVFVKYMDDYLRKMQYIPQQTIVYKQ